jgi:1,4-dihydroxy-2-naphthoate octaprenyltransferase
VQTGSLSWEAAVASVPVAILVALILYVNEIPDRVGDAAAGKRTLPVRLAPAMVTGIYLVAAVLAFAVVVGGVAAGLLPVASLLALLAAPLVWQVYGGLRRFYTQPYALMPFMATNIKVHVYVGLLLLVGYGVAILARLLSVG